MTAVCKRRLTGILCTLLVLSGISVLSAQQTDRKDALITDEQIVVLPKDVYVGDQMEIRYTFATAIDLSSNHQLPMELTAPEMEELTILSMTLSEADSTGANGYVLSVQCIPWKSGIIDIPPLQDSLTLPVDVPAISIQSILVHTGNQELRSIKSPILIPGTTWIIWLLVLLVCSLFAAILVFLNHLKKRGLTLLQFWYLIISTPHYRRTMRILRRLTRKSDSYDDQAFAQTVTQCIRTYLTDRFHFDFTAVSSSDTVLIFCTITADVMDQPVIDRVEVLERILIRMDYIRFSGSTDTSAVLTAEERNTVISAIRDAVRFLEKEDSTSQEVPDAAV